MTTESFVKKQIWTLAGFVSIIIFLGSVSFFMPDKPDSKEKKNKKDEQVEYYSLDELNVMNEGRYENTGTASYYADKFHMRKTANGETFNMNEYSAAHRNLPFGTILKVRNTQNDKATFVRINDRGPYIHDRIIDLSYRSAQAISGIGLPRVELIGITPLKYRYKADTLNNYFVGYSLKTNQDPVCLPNHAVIKIDSLKRFHNAVKYYKKYYELDDSVFLFAKASEMHKRESRRSGHRYYIGRFNDRIEKPKETQVFALNRD